MRASRVSGEALGGHHIIVDDVELGAETVKVRSEVDREVAVLFALVCRHAVTPVSVHDVRCGVRA